MPLRKFALKEGEPRRLEIHWKGRWQDVRVFLDQQLIGNIPDQASLKQGQQFSLKDGSRLSLKLVKRLGIPELEILLNDIPIADSDSHPRKKMNTAAGLLFFISGINLLIGVLAVFFQVPLLKKLGFGPDLLVFGGIYLALAFGTRRGSKAALGAGILLFALDSILTCVMLAPQASTPPTASIVIRIFILVQLISAFRSSPRPDAAGH